MMLFGKNKKSDPKYEQSFLTEKEYYLWRIASLGSFYRLSTYFDHHSFAEELSSESINWIPYNKSKPWSKRYGLSLTSLNGEIDGEIDLNSILEWNQKNGTSYNEMSFTTKTKYWKHFDSITSQLGPLENCLGRTHLLKLDMGGMFPPHRDNYREGDSTFRLIAFFDCSPYSLHVNLNGQNVFFETNKLYFLNTRYFHSLVSFQPGAILLVLNVEINKYSMEYVLENVVEC